MNISEFLKKHFLKFENEILFFENIRSYYEAFYATKNNYSERYKEFLNKPEMEEKK